MGKNRCTAITKNDNFCKNSKYGDLNHCNIHHKLSKDLEEVEIHDNSTKDILIVSHEKKEIKQKSMMTETDGIEATYNEKIIFFSLFAFSLLAYFIGLIFVLR